jgi:hypothetical protein
VASVDGAELSAALAPQHSSRQAAPAASKPLRECLSTVMVLSVKE